MTTEQPVPNKWPRVVYNLPQIFECRDKLRQDVLAYYCGTTLRREGLEGIAADVVQAFPRLSYEAVYRSAEHLVGEPFTAATAFQLSWRLAGNQPALRNGRPVLPWTAQRRREPVPVQILSSRRSHTRKGHFGASLRLRILAGSACPMVIRKWWPQGFCLMVARRAGYTRLRAGYPFSDVRELCSLRLSILLDPRHSGAVPGFEEVRCPPSLYKWNRYVIKLRFRELGDERWECPRNYEHYCYECHVGYTECPAAVHRDTYPAGNSNAQLSESTEDHQARGSSS